MTCWNCGKKGDFAGQLCDECFNKMERDYEMEQEEEFYTDFHRTGGGGERQ